MALSLRRVSFEEFLFKALRWSQYQINGSADHHPFGTLNNHRHERAINDYALMNDIYRAYQTFNESYSDEYTPFMTYNGERFESFDDFFYSRIQHFSTPMRTYIMRWFC